MDAGTAQRALGSDPTGGFCGGGTASPVPRVASAETAARESAAGRMAAAPAQAGSATPPARPRPASAQPPAATPSDRAGPRRPQAAPLSRAGLVPAGTRFLRIGVYADPQAADAAMRRVAGLGLPIARSRSGEPLPRTILAGPFDSRQAVVRAHDRLTRAGFGSLVPMR